MLLLPGTWLCASRFKRLQSRVNFFGHASLLSIRCSVFENTQAFVDDQPFLEQQFSSHVRWCAAWFVEAGIEVETPAANGFCHTYNFAFGHIRLLSVLVAQCSKTFQRLLSSAVGSKFIDINTTILFTRLLSQLHPWAGLKSLEYLYILLSRLISSTSKTRLRSNWKRLWWQTGIVYQQIYGVNQMQCPSFPNMETVLPYHVG